MPERVKCFFSAHVIEHLPNPNLIWEVASHVLADDGIIVCFCPNGDPARESIQGVRLYDHIWGKVHPMLITPRFVRSMSARSGFRAYVYSRPYRLDQISNGESPTEIIGDELCLIARRA
jgi:predicted SAM-dependent methyltransferase